MMTQCPRCGAEVDARMTRGGGAVALVPGDGQWRIWRDQAVKMPPGRDYGYLQGSDSYIEHVCPAPEPAPVPDAPSISLGSPRSERSNDAQAKAGPVTILPTPEELAAERHARAEERVEQHAERERRAVARAAFLAAARQDADPSVASERLDQPEGGRDRPVPSSNAPAKSRKRNRAKTGGS